MIQPKVDIYNAQSIFEEQDTEFIGELKSEMQFGEEHRKSLMLP